MSRFSAVRQQRGPVRAVALGRHPRPFVGADAARRAQQGAAAARRDMDLHRSRPAQGAVSRPHTMTLSHNRRVEASSLSSAAKSSGVALTVGKPPCGFMVEAVVVSIALGSTSPSRIPD